MMPGQFQEKRRFLGVRRVVDEAAPLPKAALRWAARQMEPSDLALLDKMMAMHAPPPRQGAPPEPRNLRQLFYSATPEQQVAIRYVVSRMGPAQVAELEALVGRNGRFFKEANGTK